VTPVLVDTGFLVALYDARESMHRRCLDVYQSLERRLATCEPVIGEAIYLLQRSKSAVDGILASVQNHSLEIPFRLAECAAAVNELMEKYADTPADFADACLIQMADELDTGDILTLDSDFRHYRWRRNRRFRLMVSLD
jgi:uncharacterized protein